MFLEARFQWALVSASENVLNADSQCIHGENNKNKSHALSQNSQQVGRRAYINENRKKKFSVFHNVSDRTRTPKWGG